METNLTLKFKGIEARLLDEIVRNGLFSSKSEAIRAALINYFLKLGLLGRQQQWEELQKFSKRGVSPEQLTRDLEKIEDDI